MNNTGTVHGGSGYLSVGQKIRFHTGEVATITEVNGNTITFQYSLWQRFKNWAWLMRCKIMQKI